MSMSLMQKYDWSNVEACLVYSLPEYSNIQDDNVSGLAMLNRIVKTHNDYEVPDSSISIEYQVNSQYASMRILIPCFNFRDLLLVH